MPLQAFSKIIAIGKTDHILLYKFWKHSLKPEVEI